MGGPAVMSFSGGTCKRPEKDNVGIGILACISGMNLNQSNIFHVIFVVVARIAFAFIIVPAGSPARGGDVSVRVSLDKLAELAHSLLFCSWRLFLSLRPFQLYFIP